MRTRDILMREFLRGKKGSRSGNLFFGSRLIFCSLRGFSFYQVHKSLSNKAQKHQQASRSNPPFQLSPKHHRHSLPINQKRTKRYCQIIKTNKAPFQLPYLRLKHRRCSQIPRRQQRFPKDAELQRNALASLRHVNLPKCRKLQSDFRCWRFEC
jgi:hypothetical protein